MQTALHVAASSGNLEIVTMLLEHTPMLATILDRDGWSPDRVARHKHHPEVSAVIQKFMSDTST